MPAYRGLAGELRLAYAQFQELESFSRLASRLDEETRKTLERGRRWREILKQPEHSGLSACEQIALLLAVSQGRLDEVPLSEVGQREQDWLARLRTQAPPSLKRLAEGHPVDEEARREILQVLG